MNGLILMTAMPPTRGHEFLIEYAENFMNSSFNSNLYVMVNSRSHEPIIENDKEIAFRNQFKNKDRIHFHFVNQDIVQEPSDHPDFWNIWHDIIFSNVQAKIDFVFASELYGLKLAEVLRAKFIPVNIGRDILPISATQIRNDPLKNFEWIMPEFQKMVRQTVTIFGPESVGKTTLSKALSKEINGHLVPEWAREYLETVGSDITEDKMKIIIDGQKSLQQSVISFENKPFIIQDTDLFSTLGFYRLWRGNNPKLVETLAIYLASDLYILPNDKIPFTPDQLRFGGDKRESDNSFWINILEEYSLPYYVLQSWSPEAQLQEAAKYCRNFFNKKINWRFER